MGPVAKESCLRSGHLKWQAGELAFEIDFRWLCCRYYKFISQVSSRTNFSKSKRTPFAQKANRFTVFFKVRKPNWTGAGSNGPGGKRPFTGAGMSAV